MVRDEITRVSFPHEVEVSDVANNLSLHHARQMLSQRACQSVTSSPMIGTARTWHLTAVQLSRLFGVQ